VGENALDCKGGHQEKWSSGLQEASPTDHNGDVPNGHYVQQARTCLRQWCDRIPILAIHPNCIEGAFFQIKMTPNQIRMTGYEEDAFLIFFFRFDLNSPI
jgi:hypothetical protein